MTAIVCLGGVKAFLRRQAINSTSTMRKDLDNVACTRTILALMLAALFSGSIFADDAADPARPNILWIVVEDASAHIGCYGETTIATPHIDALAREGVRFTKAFVTCPVCSPSRSAMVTGMYQTTLGVHNHRSQRTTGKGAGARRDAESYRLPVKSVPDLLRAAGYYVTNSGLNKSGKTDYNFVADGLYDKGDWSNRKPDQPFFAQIQLHGGKARRAKVADPVDPATVQLPPFYADTEVIRDDWAAYLNTWIKTDNEVGKIVSRLREEEQLAHTVLFFWTDHGISHLRGKQFLYDEGTRVPLIVRYGDGRDAGTVRHDLIEHIDIAAASLALAGIEAPSYVQGRDFLADGYEPREFAFTARDRCDETVDIIRSVRTDRFKYIRNFMSDVPHAQPNQYKDGKPIVQEMRRLYRAGELNALQASMFQTPRPVEELYDLDADPHETVNLAGEPEYRSQLESLRSTLYERMIETRDVGLIPEPILEDLGRTYGNKYNVLQQSEFRGLVAELIEVIEAGENGDKETLSRRLDSDRASVRYWAATWLGNLGDASAVPKLTAVSDDPHPAVRVAAALALCQLGRIEAHLPVLAEHLGSEHLIAGMFAARALELLGPSATPALPAIKDARNSPYSFTVRIANRLSQNLSE